MLLPRRPRYVPRMQPSSLLLCVLFKSGMKKYVCEVSKAGTCTKSGSWLTPTLYGQMEAAAATFSTATINSRRICKPADLLWLHSETYKQWGVSWFGKAQQLDLQLGWQWCLQL